MYVGLLVVGGSSLVGVCVSVCVDGRVGGQRCWLSGAAVRACVCWCEIFCVGGWDCACATLGVWVLLAADAVCVYVCTSTRVRVCSCV